MAYYTIKNRRGTTAQWATSGEILEAGEFGIEIMSNNHLQAKCGDGITPWQDLPYISSVGSDILEEFTPFKAYLLGEMIWHTVADGRLLFAAKTGFTAGAAFNPADWDEVNSAYIKNVTANDFIPNHPYVQRELVRQDIPEKGKLLFAANQSFTSTGTFDPSDWTEVNAGYLKETKVLQFQANHGYVAREVVRVTDSEGKSILYFANANFTSGTAFNPADWTEVDTGYLKDVTFDTFQDNHKYVAGEIIINPIDGINYAYRAKVDFTSWASFYAGDWDEVGIGYLKKSDLVTIANTNKEYYLDPTYVGTTNKGTEYQPYSTLLQLTTDHGSETDVTVYIKNGQLLDLDLSGIGNNWTFTDGTIHSLSLGTSATVRDMTITGSYSQDWGNADFYNVRFMGEVEALNDEISFHNCYFDTDVISSGFNIFNGGRFHDDAVLNVSGGKTILNGVLGVSLNRTDGDVISLGETNFRTTSNLASDQYAIVSSGTSGSVILVSGNALTDLTVSAISISGGNYILGKFVYRKDSSSFTGGTEIPFGLYSNQIRDLQTFTIITPESDSQESINKAIDKLLKDISDQGFNIGGALTATDLGAAPTQVGLFTYYVTQIFGAGGTVDTSDADAYNWTYTTTDGTVHQATEIFNNTWVRNTNADNLNHRRVLTNTPHSNPQIFVFTDTGVDTVAQATDTLAGIAKLYDDLNNDNTDGAVTQNVVKDLSDATAKLASNNAFTGVNSFSQAFSVPTASTWPSTASSTAVPTEAQVKALADTKPDTDTLPITTTKHWNNDSATITLDIQRNINNVLDNALGAATSIAVNNLSEGFAYSLLFNNTGNYAVTFTSSGNTIHLEDGYIPEDAQGPIVMAVFYKVGTNVYLGFKKFS